MPRDTLPFCLMLLLTLHTLGRLQTRGECPSHISIVKSGSDNRTVSVTATSSGRFNDACWSELFTQYGNMAARDDHVLKTIKLTINATIDKNIPSFLCLSLPRLETISIKFTGSHIGRGIFDQECSSLFKVTIVCPNARCSLTFNRDAFRNVSMLFSLQVSAAVFPSTVTIASQAIHDCSFLHLIHIQAERVFIAYNAISKLSDHYQLSIKAGIVDFHHHFIRDNSQPNRVKLIPMVTGGTLLPDTSFISTMPATTRLCIENTGLALRLLQTGSVSCRISVYGEGLLDTAAMALSMQHALLLLRALESGLLDYEGLCNIMSLDQIRTLQRIFPVWVANGNRILSRSASVSYAARVVFFIRRFFDTVMP